MEWLNNISGEAKALIISLITTYGGTFVAFLVSWIRLKIKSNNLEATIQEMSEICTKKIIEVTNEMTDTLDSRMASLEARVVTKINDNEDERQKEIDASALEFENALEELKSDTQM